MCRDGIAQFQLGGGGLKTHTRGVSLLGGGGLGHPSPEKFETRGSEMVFSTY